MTPTVGVAVVLDCWDPETRNARPVVPNETMTNYSRTSQTLSAGCSQRCSQRALVLKTRAPQADDLRRYVELEGIEPSTSSMPWRRSAN